MTEEMKENRLILVAEMALVRSIYDLLQGSINPGRLQNKYITLQKEVDKTLDGIKIDGKKELPVIGRALDMFAEKTGWNKKARSVGTILSFIMSMVEESENIFSDKILDLLNEIFDYHERQKSFGMLCYSAGSTASKKWSLVKKEVFYE